MNNHGAQAAVAVGVDGSPEATEAAQYAVGLADALGRDLLLVYGFQLPVGLIVDENVITDVRRGAEQLVDDVSAELRIPARMRVRRLVELASPVSLLVQVARSASILVIGRHHFNLVDQMLTGPVASAVSGAAACPVIVVPPHWHRSGRRPRPVVVALDVETPAHAVLDFAFEQAELTGTGVVALHAATRAESSFDSEERASVWEMLAGHRQDHPDVEVSARVIVGEPKETIVGQSISAGLMVVGRPHQRRLGAWTRSVAHAVLSDTHCPLAIVPETDSASAFLPAASLAEAGAK
jgi:nucleotide-binding universal stress UspA family protein